MYDALTFLVSKVTLCFFDGFESRSAGGGARPAPKAEAGGPGMKELGVPEKEQVLYSVRWVQASGKKGQEAAKKGRREFTKAHRVFVEVRSCG